MYVDVVDVWYIVKYPFFFHSAFQPVNMYPPNNLGFHDIYGNVWEWTEDHFNGLPGFATTYLYDDFSTPCFDGRHNMISVRISGSCLLIINTLVSLDE